ncbi:Zim17 [Kluyveromyces lactis]|nr:Zim17 [Kluyveromyces lactis]
MNRFGLVIRNAAKNGIRIIRPVTKSSPEIYRPLFSHLVCTAYNTRGFHASVRKLDEAEDAAAKFKNLGSMKVDKPMLMIAFTCKKCNTRSSHTMSKQAYTKGTVLIKCPGCNNRHLIADHLKIFNDNHITIEDIMKAEGESVSLTTDDLAFEDIPDSLKNVIGHYAKDAPEEMKKKLDNEKVHHLPSTEK